MKRVVVFGYGPVGREITALFAARGDDVLVAQRSAPKQLPPGATFISCDVTDANSVAAAMCRARDRDLHRGISLIPPASGSAPGRPP